MSAVPQPAAVSPAITLRAPSVTDGARAFALVRDAGNLEPNTLYAYLLLCTHFADTCLIAERQGECVGFVAAYRPPTHNDAVFVWQIGVSEAARGRGLAKRMLNALVEQPGCRGVRFVEATVAPSNLPSRALFESFARAHDAPCDVSTGFAAPHFAPHVHEAEALYRIGPFRNRS
jgi:L-2,4-diaminobutyric acid acetyltransferase